MSATKIQWATHVLNPTTGCSPVSPGCDNCYAKRVAETRLRGRCGYPADKPFRPTFHPNRLKQRFPAGSTVFVNSMGDLFHEDVPTGWVDNVIGHINQNPPHTYIIFTKRPERMKKYLDIIAELARIKGHVYHLPNLWLGVSVENQQCADERIPILLQMPAAKRIVSVEPMLSAIDISAYLGYNAQKGAEHEDNLREDNDDSCGKRGIGSGCTGENMEISEREKTQGGTPNRLGIFANKKDGSWEKVPCGCAQDRLDVFQRGNPDGNNGQSQERNKGRQQAEEFGTDGLLGTDKTRDIHIEKTQKASESKRRKKSQLQIDGQASNGNKGIEKIGLDVISNSGQLRDVVSARFRYMQRKEKGVDLIICGAETGPGKRPMELEWARGLRDQCHAAGVPFFFKQDSDGRETLDGETIHEVPK